MKSPIDIFRTESRERIKTYKDNIPLKNAGQGFLEQATKVKYGYNFFWMGVPIIQAPQDLMAMQEIIWEVKPELIIETGVAWGGSILHSASMLLLLKECGEIEDGMVVGIDIEIRPHNKTVIDNHPLKKMITLFEGSSVDESIVEQVRGMAKNRRNVLVCLDSNHTHEHVLAELRSYAPLVGVNSYCVVGDTGIEDTPEENSLPCRSWGKGNNPKTAVYEFLKENDCFEIDPLIDSKLVLTASPDGYLKRVK